MKYHQLSAEERFLIAALRTDGLPLAQIAALLERHRSTIWREVGLLPTTAATARGARTSEHTRDAGVAGC